MSWTEKNLMKDEKIVCQTRLHWFIFFRGIYFLFISTLLLVGSNYLKTMKPIAVGKQKYPLESYSRYIVIAAVVLLAFALIYEFVIFLRLKTSEFVITNLRIILKVGIISTRTLEILLKKVETISIHQGIWGRIFNFGTVRVSGTGGGISAFTFIRNPNEFRENAQEEISKAQGNEYGDGGY